MKKSKLIKTAEAAVGKLSKEQREDVIHYAQEIGVLEVVRILDMMRKVGCKSYYSLLGHLIKTAIELRNEQIELDEGFAIGVRPLFGFKISYGIKTEQKTEGMIAPEFLLIYDSEADGFKAIENGQTKLSMEEG